MGPIILGAIIGFIISRLFFQYRHLLQKPSYMAKTEYFVYLRSDQMPPQDAYMDRVVKASQISSKEAILFSDIRLHVGHILRVKNPHLFRPDLIDSSVVLDGPSLDALSDCPGLAVIRYASDQKLTDRRHLQFLVYLTEAVATLGNSAGIYDTVAQRFFQLDEFRNLMKDPDATRFDLHVSMKSSDDPTELTFETKGFRKIGLLDFKTRPVQHDLKTLGSQITEEAARNVWSSGTYGDAQELEAYDDHFLVQFDFQLRAFELPATAQLDARRQSVLVDIMRRSSR